MADYHHFNRSLRPPRPFGWTQKFSVVLISACVVVLGFGAGCSNGAREPSAIGPHPIIIINLDTLRADHLGCYGYDRATSPTIDRLAEESVLFTHAFSQAPNTPPSQTSIFSGLYPMTHGMIEDDDRIPLSVVMLAEVLQENGFATAGFHDGGYMSNDFNMGQGFDLYDSSLGGGLKKIGPKVSRWLSDHSDKNFLLMIHTYDIHTPYDPPEGYHDLFLGGLEPPTPGFEPTAAALEEIRLSVWTDEPKSLPPNDLENAKALYDGGIRWVDAWIDGFMRELQALGLDQRATIVLISDHGEEFQEHGSLLHEKLYATVTHVPLMIRLPGAGHSRKIETLVETIDLMPTLLDLVGLPVPTATQGQSLLPLIQGQKTDDAVAFGESPFFGHRRFAGHGRWRLLLTKNTGQVELYDFDADPLESRNLASDRPFIVEELKEKISAWETEAVAARIVDADEGSSLDEETRKQLKELGYIQD